MNHIKFTALTKIIVGISSILLQVQPLFAIGVFPDETLFKSSEPFPTGKIKFREDWVYHYTNGKAGIRQKSGYERYDDFGLKVEEAKFNSDGKVVLEATYTYDEYAREIQAIGTENNVSFFKKWTYNFDDNKKILTKTLFNNSVNHEMWIYKFDSAGNICEKVNFNKDGELNFKYAISYTDFNKTKELIEYDTNGKPYEKWLYIYSDKKLNTEVIHYNSSNEVLHRYINKYDENGLLQEVQTYDGENKLIEKTLSIYQYY